MSRAAIAAGFLCALWVGAANARPKPTKEKICNLQGKVRIVDAFPNYRIHITDNNPDLNIKFVVAFPNKPGKWQIVSAHEDFTVQFVENRAIADFTVWPSPFPGC